MLPETAAPAPGKFEAAFRRQQEAGADAVVCINLSLRPVGHDAVGPERRQGARRATSTCASSTRARSPPASARRCCSPPRRPPAGRPPTRSWPSSRTWPRAPTSFGALDTLDNLKKGGRIGGAQALLGSLLSIKPIVDISTGKVEEAGKARTRKKALEVLRDKIAEAGAIEHLCVTHGLAPEEAEMLDLLAPLYPRDQIRVGPHRPRDRHPRRARGSWASPGSRLP